MVEARRPTSREIDAVNERRRGLSTGERLELSAAIGVERQMMAMVDCSTGERVSDDEFYRRLMKHYGIELGRV